MQNNILKTVVSPGYIQNIVKNKYKLNDIDSTILIRSNNNDIYKINTKNNIYILKIFNLNKELKNLEFEISYTLYLKKNHILVSCPCKTVSNQYYLYIDYPEGKKLAILTDYIEGNQLKYTPGNIYLFGKNIAQLHKVSELFNTLIDKNKTYNILDVFFKNKVIVETFFKKYYPNHVEFFSYFSNMLLLSLKNVQFKQQYCHNDLHTDNAKKIGNNIFFFDFEFSGYGYIIYELSVFKWSCIMNGNIAMWQEFIKGYNSILEINNQELKYISHFIAIRDIIVMTNYIHRINIIGHKAIGDSYINKRIIFLKKINKEIILRS